MFAVIKTGGKQYKVAEGDQIVVEKLDAGDGDSVTFETVLMLGSGSDVSIGEPSIAGASVTGTVEAQRKGAKVMIFKKRQRNTYRRKRGHRQHETVVTIDSILAAGAKAQKKKAAPKKKADTAEAGAIKPEAKASPKAEKAAPKAEAKAKAKPKASPPPAGKQEADARGRLAAPQGEADDLKKIKGVGKVLEGKLNAAGIFHFWQVAGLKPDQIEELENDMSFPGRVGRDDWIAQAKELADKS